MNKRFVRSICCNLLHIDKSSIAKGVHLAISLVKWLHLPYAIVVRTKGLEDDMVARPTHKLMGYVYERLYQDVFVLVKCGQPT